MKNASPNKAARRACRTVILLAALAPLGACALASAGSGPAPSLYTLTAAHPEAPEAGAAHAPAIEIDEFSAPAAVDTARIVQQTTPNEIAYYADARWADRAPRMIQTLMVETFENGGRFAAVSVRGSGLASDYELMGDIRQFAAIPASGQGKTEVRIDFFARLVRDDDRSIVASKSFGATVPVDGSGMTPIVAAYDAGLRAVLDEIALWAAAESAKSQKAAKQQG